MQNCYKTQHKIATKPITKCVPTICMLRAFWEIPYYHVFEISLLHMPLCSSLYLFLNPPCHAYKAAKYSVTFASLLTNRIIICDDVSDNSGRKVTGLQIHLSSHECTIYIPHSVCSHLAQAAASVEKILARWMWNLIGSLCVQRLSPHCLEPHF